MTNRYDTLNVSLHTPRRSFVKANNTIDVTESRDQDESHEDNSEKVNRFKELYFRNEKLRKELKNLNERLNDKLDKLKLPSVKKKALSVDLNHKPPNPPSKALQRELENAYKQVTMYKKQVQALKGKEETQENIDKMRNMENRITFIDMEINRTQEELKSIHNIRKMQSKGVEENIENQQLKQKIAEYLLEIKQFKAKIKDIDKKSKIREQEFKKQQAYLVALEAKRRKYQAEQDEQFEVPKPKNEGISKHEFNQVKEQLKQDKSYHQYIGKKIEEVKVQAGKHKERKVKCDQKIKKKEEEVKQLQIMVVSFTRLLKDLEVKKYEQTGVRETVKQQSPGQLLKLQQLEDDSDSEESASVARYSEVEGSQVGSKSRPSNADERQWRGTMRKVSRGYRNATDIAFQEKGLIVGLKAYLDENRYLTGIAPILMAHGAKVEARPCGNVTSLELKWELQAGDTLKKIRGSFSPEGYLGEVVFQTRNGFNAQFGTSYPDDQFEFNLEQGQVFVSVFGGLRRMGQDVRITELGFTVGKK